MDLGRCDVREEELGLDHCLTFVRGLTAGEVASRLGAAETGRVRGLEQLPAGSPWLAVADLPGGAVIVEAIRGRLTFAEAYGPVSRGTSVAVVYESEHNDPAFLWVSDGEVRVSFDPGSAGWRTGREPDALLADMVELGFDLSGNGEFDPDAEFDEDAEVRALALAERVTGLRLHAGMLRELTYLVLQPR
ncbi:hypothetical protein BJY16_004951 [Actinoplanes octamycinicus]|uniref:Uncharacterized protein n=1 Tax=Actinoplanes octamycinicus TaxID=135948 RepID=A0A7W7H088_9ACTN|nr:DUF6461 domain-containing protein [Actinoplanes octamycinicus]MBB4741492.1 hypothetical protein [Actinoplanes octamycinicus]GIE57042.1 hypothetical protein Aoc01nite_24440 [Actinoplanes octamycinicus]